MADFETETTLDVVVDDRSLRAARDDIESKLGDVAVEVEGTTPESRAMGGGGASAGVGTGNVQANQLDVLEDILEEVEDLSGSGGGGGGGLLGGASGVGIGSALSGGLGGLGAGVGAGTAAAGAGSLGLLAYGGFALQDSLRNPENPSAANIPGRVGAGLADAANRSPGQVMQQQMVSRLSQLEQGNQRRALNRLSESGAPDELVGSLRSQLGIKSPDQREKQAKAESETVEGLTSLSEDITNVPSRFQSAAENLSNIELQPSSELSQLLNIITNPEGGIEGATPANVTQGGERGGGLADAFAGQNGGSAGAMFDQLGVDPSQIGTNAATRGDEESRNQQQVNLDADISLDPTSIREAKEEIRKQVDERFREFERQFGGTGGSPRRGPQ